MAAAESDADWAGAQSAVLRRRWGWVVLYMLLSVVAAWLFPALQPVDERLQLLDAPNEWVLSSGMEADFGPASTRWRSGAARPTTASRAIEVSADVQFVGLRVCLASEVAGDSAALMLASVNAAGMLDFDRHYRLWDVSGGRPGDCIEGAMPRRPDDGVAIVQLQLLIPGAALSVSELSAMPLRVSEGWRIGQPVMLVLGIALLLLPFGSYLTRRPRLFALLGLLGVVGIVFGCTVSVGLKSDIYALLTGGRSEPLIGQAPAAMLLQVFPTEGGISFFTFMHAALFAGATFTLCLVHGRAWLDMLLLAPMTETLQLFVPGRGPGVSDMLVDWLGVLVALLLVAVVRRSHRVRLFLQQQGIDEDVTRL